MEIWLGLGVPPLSDGLWEPTHQAPETTDSLRVALLSCSSRVNSMRPPWCQGRSQHWRVMPPATADLAAGVTPTQPAGCSILMHSSKAAVHVLAWPDLATPGARSGWDSLMWGARVSDPRVMVLAFPAEMWVTPSVDLQTSRGSWEQAVREPVGLGLQSFLLWVMAPLLLLSAP